MTRTCIAAALVLATAGCVTNPATGKRQLVLVPEGQAAALGEESAAEIVKSVGLLEDAEVTAYVSSVGAALAAKSEEPQRGWKFQTLDDPTVNAFALPGGYIFVTRGILAHLGSEAELAAVVGHEIGHVTGRHSVDQLSKATLAQLGLGIGAAVSEDAAKYAQIGAAGLKVLFLKYGRDDEYEADMLGVRYAGRGGYDVREMPKVFEALDRVSQKAGASKIPTWLSTHPQPTDRIERIRGHIAKATEAGETGTEIRRDVYLKTIDGIAYGDDPRKGYFKGQRFLHPVLGFEITFPQGWKTANTAAAVGAGNEAGDAALQLGFVEAASPDAALEAFLKKEGVQAGTRAAAAVPNVPSASSTFTAKTEEGVVAGLVTFLQHGGKTYGLLGLTKVDQLAKQLPAFEATRGSFAPLTDPALKNVEPARLVVVPAPRAMTLAELYAQKPSTVPLDEIALINGLSPEARLQAGQLVKTVQGGTAKP
jgi:predicted Zn-dependent protease